MSKKGKERKVRAEIKLHVKHSAAWGTRHPHLQQLKAQGTPSRISSASSLKEVVLAPNVSHLGDVSLVLFPSSVVFLLSEKQLEGKTTHDASPGPGLSLVPLLVLGSPCPSLARDKEDWLWNLPSQAHTVTPSQG